MPVHEDPAIKFLTSTPLVARINGLYEFEYQSVADKDPLFPVTPGITT
jgi:hypothetical protein